MGYIKNVGKEMKRVTWPSLGEVNKYTWTVIIMVVLLGLYFGGIDFGLSNLLNYFYAQDRKSVV